MIRSLRNAFFIILLSISITSPGFARDDISVLTLEWPPHVGSGLPEQGLISALVRAAFEAAGHDMHIDFLPWARVLKDVLEGKSDVVMGAYHTKQRATDYYMSDPVYYVDVGLVTRPGLPRKKYDSLRELARYRIGTTRGYANSEEFDNARYLNIQPVTNPILNIRKLYRGRIDMAVMEFDQFRYKAEKEGFCVGRVGYLDPPLQRHGLHIMASRKIPDGMQIIKDFNRGLKVIKQNGTFDRIMARFRN